MRHSVLAAAVLIVGATSSTGCYHATIVTGATPSTEVLYQSFASGWIYGLVPPKTIETAKKCPDGLAKVETEQSFVNGLVAILTLGIYTPMQITVTCAAKGAALGEGFPMVVGAAGSGPDALEMVAEAAEIAILVKGPVLVQFHE